MRTVSAEGTPKVRLFVPLCAMFSSALLGQTYTVSTFTGGLPPDNIPGTSASVTPPLGVAVDSAGNAFFLSLSTVFRLDATLGTLTRVAGNGTRGYSGDNGPATSAQLNCSGCGIALDSSGNIYIADGGNNVVRKVSNGVITTVAGDGNNGFSGDGGPATAARLYQPMAVAVNAAGNLYIADSANSASVWYRTA